MVRGSMEATSPPPSFIYTHHSKHSSATTPLPPALVLRARSMVAALAGGMLSMEGDWCSSDGRFTDDRITLGQAGKPVFGKVTFYVTHAWSYK